MNNSYTILITNNKKNEFLKFDNIISNIKFNTNCISISNYIIIKLIFLSLLFILFECKISRDKQLNDIKNVEDKGEKFNEEQAKQQSLVNLNKDFWNTTFLKNEMHYYSLYKIFKKPKFSLIIIYNESLKINVFQISNQFETLINQNFSDIEIILYLHKIDKKNYQLLINELQNLTNENILKIFEKKENVKYIDFNLINILKGRYTIFINNINIIKNLQFENLFNYTKNKINNYFSLNISNDSNIYIFKTKALKDLIEKGIEFNSFDMALNIIKSYPSPNLNYIHISLCPDNSFTKYALVSMSSILSSKASYTYVCFYLVVPSDYDEKNKNILDSLYEMYDYFNITFLKMDNRYNKAYTDKRITKQAYYRFSLGELLPNLNKVIYLDTDVIVYKDLSNFYDLNFNGKMILGHPTYGNKKAQKHGFHRINTGVLLLNLFEMRKNQFEEKVIKVINKGIKFKYHDQTLVDDYFKQYLGIFAPEYHTRPWSNYKEMEIFNRKIGKVYDQDYFYFAHKYPTIRHFLGGYKPKNPNVNHIEDWWFYARKSKYYINGANTYNSAFYF